MCIRDRDTTGHYPLSKRHADGGAQGRAGAGVCRDGRPGNCPLYTSDAADDLLCVALGGRRIIKKKIDKHHK
mgnify:CR=1 FL=1